MASVGRRIGTCEGRPGTEEKRFGDAVHIEFLLVKAVTLPVEFCKAQAMYISGSSTDCQGQSSSDSLVASCRASSSRRSTALPPTTTLFDCNDCERPSHSSIPSLAHQRPELTVPRCSPKPPSAPEWPSPPSPVEASLQHALVSTALTTTPKVPGPICHSTPRQDSLLCDTGHLWVRSK
jgi:hypothetical protein